MNAKRPSLAETMRQAVQADPSPMVAALPASSATEALTSAQSKPDIAPRPAGFYAATRAGKKKVTATLDPTTHKKLKTLAVDKEVTTESLLAEAISDLLIKHAQTPPKQKM
ncbi:hypothetical protein ACOSOMT5_P2913 [Acidiphilium sp. MT5]